MFQQKKQMAFLFRFSVNATWWRRRPQIACIHQSWEEVE